MGNDSLQGATLLHNEFHPIIFDEQRGELSWGTCGCRHGMHLKAWHVSDHMNACVCQNDTGGVSSRYGSVEHRCRSGSTVTCGMSCARMCGHVKADDDNVWV